MPKTVAVDFDNTIHPYTRGWIGEEPDDEPAISGAEEFLFALIERGYHVVIHTTRAETIDGYNGVVRWLAKHLSMVYRALLDHAVEISAEKPKAVAYVDDRAVVFRGSYTDCLTDIDHLERHGPRGGHRANK